MDPRHNPHEALRLEPDHVLTPEGPVQGWAMLIKDGVITAVNETSQVKALAPDAAVLPLPGRLIMPGFVDAHHHLTQSFGKALAFGEPSEIFRRVWVPLEGFLDQELVYLSGKLAALEALRGGFTTVADAGTRSAAGLEALAQATREAGLRCVLGCICNDGGSPEASNSDIEALRTRLLRNAEAHLALYEHDPLLTPSLAVSIPDAASDFMLERVYALCRESGRVFQTHVNEHLVAVERSLVARKLRPLEHLLHAKALGPHTLAAHCTLVTPSELRLLADTGTFVSYNPVASQWKGNAVAPALHMDAQGIGLGLGTDGTRSDGFRLADAAEASQRLAYGLASGDSSCGGGARWLEMGTTGGATALGLGAITGTLAPGMAADFLVVNMNVPEMKPSWDIPWELVRLANRDQIEAVFVQGRMRLKHGWPTDWDAHSLMAQVDERVRAAVEQAPIVRVHGPSAHYAAFRKTHGLV